MCLRCEDVEVERDGPKEEAEGCNSDRQSQRNSTIQHVDVSKRWQDGLNRRDCWSSPGTQGQRSACDWLCWFSLSLSLIPLSLTCFLYTPPLLLLRLLLLPSSSPGQLRQISRTHSHRAVTYPDSTLRLVFCFQYIRLQKCRLRVPLQIPN